MSGRLVPAIVRHPALWLEALRAAWGIRCKEWRIPLLCVLIPETEYLRWRIGTAYGDPDAEVDPADVIAYLRWRRRQRRS